MRRNFRKERSSTSIVDMPTGLEDYEETGTCVSEETLQEQREAREKMRKLREKMREMRQNLK